MRIINGLLLVFVLCGCVSRYAGHRVDSVTYAGVWDSFPTCYFGGTVLYLNSDGSFTQSPLGAAVPRRGTWKATSRGVVLDVLYEEGERLSSELQVELRALAPDTLDGIDISLPSSTVFMRRARDARK